MKNKDEWIKRNKMAISKMFIQLKRKMAVVVKIKRRPRMGRVQGGARAAFATPSWGPALQAV